MFSHITGEARGWACQQREAGALLVWWFSVLPGFLSFTSCVWLLCLHLCMDTTFIECLQETEEELGPLGLESRRVLSHCVGTGN